MNPAKQALYQERRSGRMPFTKEGLLEICQEETQNKQYCGKVIDLNFVHKTEMPKVSAFSIADLNLPEGDSFSEISSKDSSNEWMDSIEKKDASWEERSMTNSYYAVETVRDYESEQWFNS